MPDERLRHNVELPPPDPENEEQAAGLYERFIDWAVELPWWAIILAVFAVIVIYSMLTSEIYRRAIRFLTDDPQWSTTDLYDAVLIVGDDVLVEGEVADETVDTVESVMAQLLKEESKATGDIISETPARITIRTADGLVTVSKEDVITDERTEVDGVIQIALTYTESTTIAGIITEITDDVIRVRTVDEESETFAADRVISQDVVGQHTCGENPDVACEEGDIVTIQRAGDTFSGRLLTLSNTNVRVDVGESDPREERLNEIESYTVGAWSRAFNADAVARRLADGDAVRIGYYAPDALAGEMLGDMAGREMVSLPLVYDEGDVDVTLVRFDDPAGLFAATETGEVDGLIYVALGPEHPEFDAFVAQSAANLVGTGSFACEKNCAIEVRMSDDEITGRIAETTDDEITVVTTEAEFVTAQRSAILEERKMQPGVCAVNNTAGCDTGMFLTLEITFKAYALALIIGLIVGIMRVPSKPTTLIAKLVQTVIKMFSTLYVEVIRGIPLLVILIYAGFVVAPQLRDHPQPIPDELEALLDAVLMVLNLPFQAWNALGIYDIGDLGNFPNPIKIDMKPEEQAVVGLAFGYGAFIAEIFRAGIQSINRGQMEAARSLGMSYPQAMRHVVLPQAIRVVLPPLGNDFIAMLKDSALISVLALPDLLQLGRLFVSRTFRAFEGYNSVAVLYLLMTLFLSTLVRIVERRTKLPE